jgi:hypothetical protein
LQQQSQRASVVSNHPADKVVLSISIIYRGEQKQQPRSKSEREKNAIDITSRDSVRSLIIARAARALDLLTSSFVRSIGSFVLGNHCYKELQ